VETGRDPCRYVWGRERGDQGEERVQHVTGSIVGGQ
jgi:hypothetical protein